MASLLVIPVLVVVIVGLSGYLIYKLVVYDMMCARSVNRTLHRYGIRKTPFQIIDEYYRKMDKPMPEKDVRGMEKDYRQNDPEQFLSMYDALMEKDE